MAQGSDNSQGQMPGMQCDLCHTRNQSKLSTNLQINISPNKQIPNCGYVDMWKTLIWYYITIPKKFPPDLITIPNKIFPE